MASQSVFRRTLFPLFLVLACPFAVVFIWYCCSLYDGSLWRMVTQISLARLAHDWPWPTVAAAKIVGAFAALELVLMIALPGKRYFGPVTPAGERMVYKINGLFAWVVTHALLYVGAFRLHWFNPGIVYDHFGSIIMTLNLFALLFCVFLYIKGAYFPSGKDAGTSGNIIFDYYWGTELHPRVLGFDLKQFANCRLGMMGWSVIILSFLGKQWEQGHIANSMMVSVALQIVYIVKFFWWESGYLASLDVMHDRFGFYICWGVLTWLPVVYTSQTLYLVTHPIELAPPVAVGIFLFGVIAIWINYDADAQRQRVRQTDGDTTIWGKKPQVIIASYTTKDGQQKQSLLLASGWWSVSRHFHYIAEISLALAWTLPCGFDNYLPYFYVTFLTILLTDRALRDDKRCNEKYGEFWKQYCERVPYKIIPGVF